MENFSQEEADVIGELVGVVVKPLLPLVGMFLDDLELVPVLRPDLMAGNTVLLFLVKWSSPFPLRSGGRLFSA